MLKTQRARWNSPLRYNDPFDCYFSMDLKFDLRRAGREHTRRLLELIYQEAQPPLDPAYRFSVWVSRFRDLAGTIPREVMKSRIGDMGPLSEKLLDERNISCRKEWAERMANYRVFCVCEKHDNVLLWSHYADCHKGVAFELDGFAEKGIPLSVAKRVVYCNRVPSLHTRKEWIDVGLGLIPVTNGAEVWKRLVTTKARSWAYEREWRLILGRRPEENTGYADLPFDPKNVSKLLLGCKITPRQRNAIMRLAVSAFSHVEIHQARQSPTKFALEFERLR
jgi:hypothetical protein